MRSQLEFVIESTRDASNHCTLMQGTLASLYVPATVVGNTVSLVGSFDGIHYMPLDYEIDVTQSKNKGVIITQLQNYCCGLRAIQLKVDAPQTERQLFYGGVLC